MAKAMIISVGGTSAPIIESICYHQPEFISFFASQNTNERIFEIKTNTHDKDIDFKYELTLVDNVNDLLHCHEKAKEAVVRVTSKQFKKDDVIVDYTGGTKNMSVALSLAAITHGFAFSYVGGTQRSKNGVGTVENGHEKIYPGINPWDFLAVTERKEIALLFNQHQFSSAKELTSVLAEKTTKNKTIFKQLNKVINGYYNWDLFRHKDAQKFFERAKLDDLITEDDSHISKFSDETNRLMPFLQETIKDSNDGKKPCFNYIVDLYANAERRMQEGKVDDAILRIYRIVELSAQKKLLTEYQINASNAPREKLPEQLREDYIRQYTSKHDGKIKIPQAAAFVLLDALGDPLGEIFKNNKNQFRNIQSSRNHSYLAHGFESSKEKTYITLRDFILSLDIFKKEDVPVFPTLEL